MNGPNLKNYEELCRLCASYDAIKIPIFSERGKERNLKDKITTCLPFEVLEDDLLPKSLCYRCIYNLENFYDFRRGCIEAKARLENVIRYVLRGSQDHNAKTYSNQRTEEQVSDRKLDNDTVSDVEEDAPNPADFLEACLGDSSPRGGNTEEEGPFSCKICGRLFNSKSSLTIHTKFHQDCGSERDRDSYSCYVCDKNFSSKGHLALHSKVHIGETGVSPVLPNSLFSRGTPATSRYYHCDLCNKSYTNAKHLWGHVSTVHKGHPLVTCKICERTFSSVADVEDHKRIKHKGEPMVFDAEIEGNSSNSYGLEKKFLSEEIISNNKRKSTKPRKIERDSEEQKSYFIEDAGLQNEESQKNCTNVLYSCFLCNEKYPEAQSLGSHLLQMHNYEGPPVDLENLKHEYSEGDFMESMVEAETVFCCEICIREFNDRASLWLHMLYSHKDAASKACGICLKICTDNEALVEHVDTCHPRNKTEQRRYSCQVCARQHDSRKKLVIHAKIHKLVDAEGRLVDPETVVVLNSNYYGGEGNPNSIMGDENNFMPSCDICYKIFDTEAKLVKHKKSVHRDSIGLNGSGPYHFYFACEICGLSHVNRTERWKHMATTHAGDPTITCDVGECGKVFTTNAIKQEHCSTHHTAQGQFPNTCEVCGKIWKTRVEYWKHMMGVHPDCLPFICGVCLKVFTDLSNLVNHVRGSHWPLLGGDFCCDICGRPYSKVSKMMRHRKIHSVPDAPPELQSLLSNPKVEPDSHFLQQSSSLICDLCEGSTVIYENIETLGKHRQETHNVMPCDLCAKYYGRTSHLWKHVNKIHKGHPDVTCPICQRTSASKSHLATHMSKLHRTEDITDPSTGTSGSKIVNGLHTCEKCEKIFRKESLVRKHIKHCKGPRPPPIPLPPPVNGIYTCERCSKSFGERNLLYKHMKSSHITYKCEICNEKGNTKTELYQHICQEHSEHPDVKCSFSGCDKILRCKADLEKHQKGHRVSVQLHYCIYCAELITSKFKMRRHLKAMHGNETKCLCSLCLKAFSSFDILRDHVSTVHAGVIDRGFTCQICAKPCSNKSKLLEHIKYHRSNFLPCKICLKIFSSQEELDNHINNHPENIDEEDQIEDVDIDPNSILDIIGASTSHINLEDKSNIETKKRKMKVPIDIDFKKLKPEIDCDICSSKFKSNAELRRHTRNVHKKRSLNSSKNILETDLSIRMNDVSNDWELSMEKDPNTTFMHQLGLMPDLDKSSKMKNVRKVYSDDYSPSECEVCGKIWPAKRYLWQHMIRFHREKAGTTCGVCVKFCPDYPCLSAHLAIEHPSNFEGEANSLTCKVCGKYHNAKSKLQAHVGVHSGHELRALESVHYCLICNQTFEEFSHFCQHIKTQHKIDFSPAKGPIQTNKIARSNPILLEKLSQSRDIEQETSQKLPFHSCNICSLVFASEIGLANHKRIHENSDSFKCGQCGEVFSSAQNLSTHKQEKHKGTEFVCADCKSNFSTYSQLTEHNKECKMKLKNLNNINLNGDDDVDENMLLDGENEEMEGSFEANYSNEVSSGSDEEDDERSELYNEEHISEISGSDGEVLGDDDDKSILSEGSSTSHKEPRAVEVYLCDSTVEVVKVDVSDDGSKL